MLEPRNGKIVERGAGQIVTLTSESEWRSAADVLRTLRPNLDAEQFVARRAQLSSEGYFLLGFRLGERVVSIASYAISPHAVLGRELLIHDMATLPEFQGCGHASALIAELILTAKRHGCGRLFAHTRNAQSLYLRNGFEEYSTGMVRRVGEL